MADRCFSTKQMFPKLIKSAKILGPKGLMPSPARGTVSDDLTALLKKQDAATAFVAADDGVVSIKVGETSWEPKAVLENMRAVYQAIVDLQPSKLKGKELFVLCRGWNVLPKRDV